MVTALQSRPVSILFGMSSLDEELANEEQSDMTDEDKHYFDAALNLIDEHHREKFLQDQND